MENMETYWAIANQTIAIINILIEGWLVYSFVKPFMKKKASPPLAKRQGSDIVFTKDRKGGCNL